MPIKKLVIQLEKHINAKFPEYQAKFYLIEEILYTYGMDNSLFGYGNFKKLLD